LEKKYISQAHKPFIIAEMIGDLNTITTPNIAKSIASMTNAKVNLILKQQAKAIDGLSGERVLNIVKTILA